jgi:hypothetical protein
VRGVLLPGPPDGVPHVGPLVRAEIQRLAITAGQPGTCPCSSEQIRKVDDESDGWFGRGSGVMD